MQGSRVQKSATTLALLAASLISLSACASTGANINSSAAKPTTSFAYLSEKDRNFVKVIRVDVPGLSYQDNDVAALGPALCKGLATNNTGSDGRVYGQTQETIANEAVVKLGLPISQANSLVVYAINFYCPEMSDRLTR